MKRRQISLAGAVLAALLGGCSKDPPPAPSGAAAAVAPDERAFTLTLESSSPSVGTPPGAGAEFKASTQFDHQAIKAGDKLVVRQRAVGKVVEVNDAALAAKFGALVGKMDWAKKKQAADKEALPDGGRVVSVSIERAGQTTSYRTFGAATDPELSELMAMLRSFTGYPAQ